MRAGIDGLAHPPWRSGKAVDEEVLGLFRERPEMFVLLTLWSTRNEIFGRRPAWIDDPLLRETFTDEDIALLENPAVPADAPARWKAGIVPRGVAALKAAGVRFGLGDDTGATNGGQYFGFGSHLEMASMVEAGLTPAEAIVAATRTSAAILEARRDGIRGCRQERGLHRPRRESARRHQQHAPDRRRLPARDEGGSRGAPREMDAARVRRTDRPRFRRGPGGRLPYLFPCSSWSRPTSAAPLRRAAPADPARRVRAGHARAAQPRERRAVTAYPVTTPLDDRRRPGRSVLRTVQPASDFIQIEPQDGAPATEKTEMWVGFDRDTVYLTFRCWESRMDRVVAKEMRRDNTAIWGGDDVVVFYLDTFNDGRNGFQFVINSIGGRGDGQASNDGAYNGDFNTIWDVSTGRFDGGWIIETAVPFKSLRYQPGAEQVWGINVVRTNRWKNELSFLNPVPKERGQAGRPFLLGRRVAARDRRAVRIARTSSSSRTPSPTRRARPTAGRGMRNDLTADVGVDAKYGLTQNLTADLTYNTDFAQVEADQQQVNLTRFSLFFPEKRDFFLENQGMFTFGGASNFKRAGNVPILFYSRRIGLERGQAVPIRGGGRLTGRVGRYTLGLINIQTGDEQATAAQPTNFSVVRVRRDILRRSSVGLLMTGRTAPVRDSRTTSAYGVDGTFGFFQSLSINTYWARTEDHVRRRPTAAAIAPATAAQLDYNGDRYGLQLERLAVGDAFNPGVGYVRRPDMRRSFGQARFSPRPQRNGVVRKYSWTGSIDYVENGAGRLETREHEAEFGIDFQNADRFTATYTATYEFLPRPFRIASNVTLPVGGYDFDTVRLAYNRANRQRVAGNLSLESGTFYSGRKTAIGLAAGRVNVTPRFSVEPTYSVNWVDLPQGQFTSQLIGSRVTFTATPFMFTSALAAVQLRHALALDQRPAPVGVSSRQRALRRLQRRARHVRPRVSRPHEPRVHRQGQSAVPVLNL